LDDSKKPSCNYKIKHLLLRTHFLPKPSFYSRKSNTFVISNRYL
jgi:hypothetical protein